MIDDMTRLGWLLLAISAAIFFVAISPERRQKWQWGRTGDGPKISVFGWAAWTGAFFFMSLTAFKIVPDYVFFIAPSVIFFAGIFDSVRKK